MDRSLEENADGRF